MFGLSTVGPAEFKNSWISYTAERRGTYEFRCRTRYVAVANKMFEYGLTGKHAVLDVGAGSCQFGKYLRSIQPHTKYTPVDAVIDGTDLDQWAPPKADFITCIEVIEHLHRPKRLISLMKAAAKKLLVLTTPNDEVVDVLDCDPTHISVVTPEDLIELGFKIERHSWFGTPNDSLLAWFAV